MTKKRSRKLTQDPSVVFNFKFRPDAKQVMSFKTNMDSETIGLDSNSFESSCLSSLKASINRYSKSVVSDVQKLIGPILNENNPELMAKFNSYQKEIELKFNILSDLMNSVHSEWTVLQKNNNQLHRLNELLFEKVRTLNSSKQSKHNEMAIQCDIDESKLDEPLNVIKDKECNSNGKDLAKFLDKDESETHINSGTNNSELSKDKNTDLISIPDYILNLCEHKNQVRDLSDCTKIILLGLDDNIGIPDIMIAINEKIGSTIPSINFERKHKLRQGLKYNWTISVTSWIADLLIQHGKLNINSVDYTVRPFINIKRCFHCQQIGHQAKFCAYDLACANCGESHTSDNCKNASRCINCIAHNRAYNKFFDINHPAFSTCCNTFKFYFKQKQAFNHSKI